MGDYRDKPLLIFTRRFLESPVRWVVLAHAALLLTVITLQSVIQAGNVLQWLDASLVIAQVALLMIWMTFGGPGAERRTFRAAVVVGLILVAHTPGPGKLNAIPGMICLVPALFMALTILALPLLFAQSMGMQLLRFDAHAIPPALRMQFSIRAVLLLSVAAAVLFGLKGIPEMAFSQPDSAGNSAAAALAIVVMIVVALAIYLSIPLVAVWAVLTPGKILPRMATAIVGWGLGGLLVFHYTDAREGTFQLEIPVTVTAGGLVILVATLLVLRAMHYRVVWDTYVDILPADSPFQPASPFEATTDGSHHAPPTNMTQEEP
jgi:hypothetical protein